jgi:HipA-like kinase
LLPKQNQTYTLRLLHREIYITEFLAAFSLQSSSCSMRIQRRRTALPNMHGPIRNSQNSLPELPEAARLGASVQAVEYVRRMRGASQPFLLRADDDGYYVVKFQNNPQHPRILANETLAGRLALLLGLPGREPAFVEVPAELIAGNPQMEIEVGVHRAPCAAGVQFGSSYPGVPGQTLILDFLPDRLLRRIPNLHAIFLGALVFDKWTCNCDGRQMIFTRPAAEEGSAYQPWLIDNGFCFNDGEWNFPDSPVRSVYPRRLVYESVRGLHSFEPFLSRVENLDARQIEDCVKGIPAAWCGDDPGGIHRLAERLYQRRRRVRQALVDAKNSDLRLFPNWP